MLISRELTPVVGSELTPVGWGVVGIGDITCRTMAPGMAANPHSRVAAAASRTMSKAEEFVAAYDGARAYDSVAGLVSDPEVAVPISERAKEGHAR